MAYYGGPTRVPTCLGPQVVYPGTPAAAALSAQQAMIPAPPIVAGSAPCPLCQKYHSPQDGCHKHHHHHHSSSSSSHRHSRHGRREKDSDSGSDRRSRKSHHSRKHSKRRTKSHTRSKVKKGKSRRSRHTSPAGSESSELSSSSSSDSDDSNDGFHPSATQLLKIGEKMSEDVGVTPREPQIPAPPMPAPIMSEALAPRDMHPSMRRANSHRNFRDEQPIEREEEEEETSVNPLEAAFEQAEEARTGQKTRARFDDSPMMRPVGADSQFQSTGYQPVKSPTLPPHARLSAIHPSASAMQHWQDSPMISESLPSSRASSLRRSRPSMSRAPSSYNYHQSSHHGGPGMSQLEALEAALQHKSVSEAAFPLSSSNSSSRQGSRHTPPTLSPPPAAVTSFSSGRSGRSHAPPPKEVFVPVSVSNSRQFTAMQPGDPRFYTSYENHPYRLAAAPKSRLAEPPINLMEDHPLGDYDFQEGRGSACAGCFGTGA